MKNLSGNLVHFLKNLGITGNSAELIESFIAIFLIILLAYLSNLLTKYGIVNVLTKLAKRTRNQYDDAFVRNRVFEKLSHIVPALIIYFSVHFVSENQSFINVVHAFSEIYMVLMVLVVFNSLLNTLHDIFSEKLMSKNINIKGYVQLSKILIIGFGLIVIFSIILNETPFTLLAGLGAMAAVLLLIFKDTILGFVASIQLSVNEMVKPGDWIAMPDQNADGIVLDITINTVKVQNWDKTITTIPTNMLVSKSFTNWKGMQASGGRRIKRSFNIDLTSIKFVDEPLMQKFEKIILLKDYLLKKKQEIESYHIENQIDSGDKLNSRRLSNVGVFRKYIEQYLWNNPLINKELTFLVRQLQAEDKGLPIEIYVFSNDQRWAYMEAIQSDIFDHIFAIAPLFEIRLFQNPTGYDFHSKNQFNANVK